MLDNLNLLYDSKTGGNVSPTILFEIINSINNMYFAKGLDSNVTEYQALLPKDQREFILNHVGLDMVAIKFDENVNSIKQQNSITKVM